MKDIVCWLIIFSLVLCLLYWHESNRTEINVCDITVDGITYPKVTSHSIRHDTGIRFNHRGTTVRSDSYALYCYKIPKPNA